MNVDFCPRGAEAPLNVSRTRKSVRGGVGHMKDEVYWWYIILESKQGSEEILYHVAQASNSIGAETLEAKDYLRTKLYYRSDLDLEECIEKASSLIKGFVNVRIHDAGKEEWRPWLKMHKEAFPPLLVGDRLVVLAPWHKHKVPLGRIPIYIEPGSAFGTGYHASTQIALRLLEKYLKPGDKVLDVGTGSGILSIAALKLGAAKVIARDIDPAVKEEVEKNALLNDVTTGLILEIADGTRGFNEVVDCIVSNILYEPLIAMLDSFKKILVKGGFMIMSGLLLKERECFVEAVKRAKFSIAEELEEEDWWGVVASHEVR